MTYRWWVQVSGDPWAFKYLSVDLPKLQVEECGEVFLLACEDLDAAEGIEEVWMKADRLVQELNDIRIFADWDGPLKFEWKAVERRMDGSQHHYLRPIAGSVGVALGRARVRGVGQALAKDGSVIPPPRTLLQRAAELRDRDPTGFGTALSRLSSAGHDPRILYMVWEIIRGAHGWNSGSNLGREQLEAFYRRLSLTEQEAALFHSSIQARRHEGRRAPLNAMSDEDLRRFLERVLRCWLDREVPA